MMGLIERIVPEEGRGTSDAATALQVLERVDGEDDAGAADEVADERDHLRLARSGARQCGGLADDQCQGAGDAP